MGAWLDPQIVHRLDRGDCPRSEHRNAGIFRDFHDLTFIVNSPEPMHSILKGFHAGTTYVVGGNLVPIFGEFMQLAGTAKKQPIPIP